MLSHWRNARRGLKAERFLPLVEFASAPSPFIDTSFLEEGQTGFAFTGDRGLILHFSTRLAEMPDDAVAWVVAHELAHVEQHACSKIPCDQSDPSGRDAVEDEAFKRVIIF